MNAVFSVPNCKKRARMQVYFRMHGYLKPVCAQLYEKLQTVLSGMDCDLDGEELHFHHEGDFLDEHEIMDTLRTILPARITGIIDCIDMQGWQMERHFFTGENWKTEKIHLNEVMDKKNYEQSG